MSKLELSTVTLCIRSSSRSISKIFVLRVEVDCREAVELSEDEKFIVWVTC
jgi:hypothetical protein